MSDGISLQVKASRLYDIKYVMDTKSVPALIERPSTWLPPVMSMIALVVVVGHLIAYGAVREPDEGTAAHIWQLLMAGQLPFVAWHAVRWIPRAPALSLGMFAVQIVAILAAIAPVWWFRL